MFTRDELIEMLKDIYVCSCSQQSNEDLFIWVARHMELCGERVTTYDAFEEDQVQKWQYDIMFISRDYIRVFNEVQRAERVLAKAKNFVEYICFAAENKIPRLCLGWAKSFFEAKMSNTMFSGEEVVRFKMAMSEKFKEDWEALNMAEQVWISYMKDNIAVDGEQDWWKLFMKVVLPEIVSTPEDCKLVSSYLEFAADVCKRLSNIDN